MTPRLINLATEAYLRRRGWAAFHAGYGLHAKDAKLEHLTGRQTARPPMAVEEMMANLDRHFTAIAARDAALNS